MHQTAPEIKTIDGIEFQVMPLDPMTAFEMAFDLSKALAPSLGALVDQKGGVSDLMEAEATASLFGNAAEALFKNTDKAMLRDMITKLSKVTLIDKVPMSSVMDAKMTGKFGTLVKWLAFALKVQFADFFAEARNAATGLGASLNQSASQDT